MPISITWDDEAQSVLRLTYESRWTWDEFYEAFRLSGRYLRSADYEVSVINDVSGDTQPPQNLMGNLQTCLESLAPNVGLIVFVGDDLYAAAVVEVMRGMYPLHTGNWHATETLDDARALIYEWRVQQHSM